METRRLGQSCVLTSRILKEVESVFNKPCDTLPLSLESNAEISKGGKVAERSEDLIVEAHSDKEDARPKRVTKKPTYLKDYV